MKKRVCIILLVSITFFLASCSNETYEAVNFFTQKDSQYPVLLEVTAQSDRVMKLTFDEEVFPYGTGLSEYETVYEGNSVYVTLPDALDAGETVTLTARVKDRAGNSVGFSTPVWGYNPTPAGVLINEFTVNSTENQPQRTEIYVRSGGLISGFCLYGGTPDNFENRVIMPSVRMNGGTYIVVWWISEDRFKELFSLSEGTWCTVKDVLHVCACTENKLPASNGILTLTVSPSPGSRILDCAVYSKMNATTFGGFGSEDNLSMAKYIESKNQWNFDDIESSEAIDVSDSTSTRSVARRGFADTNSREDWYVTVKNGLTFGSENTSDEYVSDD